MEATGLIRGKITIDPTEFDRKDKTHGIVAGRHATQRIHNVISNSSMGKCFKPTVTMHLRPSMVYQVFHL